METIQITNDLINKHIKNKPSRFDMAINFYCCVEKEGKYYLVTYYYNPAWNLYYPFYDDISKTPILKQSKSQTYGELINETDQLMDIELNNRLELAKNRFNELIGCYCNVIKVNESYELKFSKTANLYTIYKFYNYLITDVGCLQTVLNPKQLECKMFELDRLETNVVVSNAINFCKEKEQILKQYALKF